MRAPVLKAADLREAEPAETARERSVLSMLVVRLSKKPWAGQAA